jgi:hypothetical protein
MAAKRQQTHAKRARELAVKERRERKAAKKAERAAGINWPPEDGVVSDGDTPPEDGVVLDGDTQAETDTVPEEEETVPEGDR